MRCIEITFALCSSCSEAPMNNNMRCIEMMKAHQDDARFTGWITTWDVLKSYSPYAWYCQAWMNNNMRCIEIKLHYHTGSLLHRWITTSDVLKCCYCLHCYHFLSRWITTWDVLKLIQINSGGGDVGDE